MARTPGTARRSLVDRLLAVGAKAHAHHQLRRFMRAAGVGAATQERVFSQKIRRHAESAFGQEHGFAAIHNYADFLERVPIRNYEGLRPYLDRVVAGDTDALLAPGQQVLMFAVTSGTTNRPKHVPVTREFLNEYRRGWNVFGLRALLDHPAAVLRPILQVVSPLDETRTEHGVPCGAISGLLAATQKKLVQRFYVLPKCVGRISDAEARYYTILRLALPQDVAWMITASPATQLRIVRTAEAHAEQLIRDIRDGTLTAPGEVPAAVYAQLDARLQPNPHRATELEKARNQNGALRPRNCWNLALLSNWMGGTMGLHLREFGDYFGDVPVRDIGLLATEGRVSIPLEDGTPAGVLDVTSSFFEFIDTEAINDDSGDCDLAGVDRSAIRRCHELVAGREYRVVMSTSAGFFRYDLGDYVRVTGFLGEAPIVEFLHRGAHVSSVTGEKLTEWQVTRAFERTCGALGLSIESFVLAPAWGDPPQYRLYLDGHCAPQLASSPSRLVRCLDAELSALNVEYASKRHSNRLGPIVVSALAPGTLARLDAERRRDRGAANEQFKHQYLYTRPGQDDSLQAAQTELGVR